MSGVMLGGRGNGMFSIGVFLPWVGRVGGFGVSGSLLGEGGEWFVLFLASKYRLALSSSQSVVVRV